MSDIEIVLSEEEKEEDLIAPSVEEEQDHFDAILEMRDHLIKNSYTFDTLRYIPIHKVVDIVYNVFEKTNSNTCATNQLSSYDIRDYKQLIYTIFDDNTFEISLGDIIKLHIILQRTGI